MKVGFPLSPDTNSAASIARFYALVKINETQFFENIISARFEPTSVLYQSLVVR